jgi:uncharacterized membrane protein YoaK (UPF0700 family)
MRDPRNGPLPLLLILLTVVTGLVDAVSYLALGHVFVANMTGNVVFLGFAVVDAEDFSVPASLTAIAAFLFGALAGGRLAAWHGAHRGRLLAATLVIETLLTSFALAVTFVTIAPAQVGRYVIIATLSIAMACRTQPPGGWPCPISPLQCLLLRLPASPRTPA